MSINDTQVGVRMSIAATQPAPAGWRIECLQDEDELLALREPWDELLAEAPDLPVFLTWEWMSTWWRHRADSEELMLLLAYDGGGRLIGMAPWMRLSRRLGPLTVRCVTFIGTGFAYPAHLDVIARQEDRQAVTAAFLGYLRAHPAEWDVLELKCLSESSYLGSDLLTTGGKWLEFEPQVAPFISLPDSWDAYEQVLPASRRQQIRSRRRRLLRDYPDRVCYDRVEQLADLDPALDALAHLSNQRWGHKGMISSFARRSFEAFFRDVTALMLTQGKLRLHLLRVDDRVIAAHCGFRHGDSVCGYQTSFAMDWSKYRPGQVMQAHVVQAALEEGACAYDLLQGASEYKFFWTDQTRRECFRMWSRSYLGHAWATANCLFEQAKRLARRILPARAQRRIERIIIGSRG